MELPLKGGVRISFISFQKHRLFLAFTSLFLYLCIHYFGLPTAVKYVLHNCEAVEP